MGKSGKQKNGKKGKEEDEESSVHTEQAEEEDLVFQKTLLEIRVRELEELNKGEESETSKVEFEETLEERNDIIAHLERTLKIEKTNVKELEDRLYGTLELRKLEAAEYEKEMKKKDEIFKQKEEESEKRIIDLNAKLASLEEFRSKKETLSAETNELKETLKKEREEFQSKFDELEKKQIQFKESIKNDAIQMVLKTAKLVKDVGKSSLTSCIKAAISSNITLQEQLEDLSHRNVVVREELENVKGKYKEAQKKIKLWETSNFQLNKKMTSLQSVIHRVINKCKDQDIMIQKLKDVETKYEQLQVLHANCKSIEEAESLVKERIEDELLFFTEKSYSSDADNEKELSVDLKEQYKLREIVIRTALAAKNFTQVQNEEEYQILKECFHKALIDLHRIACDLPGLDKDIQRRLFVNAPTVEPFFKFQ